MFYLLKSKDNHYSVIASDKIRLRSDRRYFKYAGHNFEVISRSGHQSDLNQIAQNLEMKSPQVLLSKISKNISHGSFTHLNRLQHLEPLSIEGEDFDAQTRECNCTVKLCSHNSNSSVVTFHDHDYSYNSDSLNVKDSTNSGERSDVQESHTTSSDACEKITKSDNNDTKISIRSTEIRDSGILQQLEPVTHITLSDETEAKLTKDNLHLQQAISDFKLDINSDMSSVSDDTRPNTTENVSEEQINLTVPLQLKNRSDCSDGQESHTILSDACEKITTGDYNRKISIRRTDIRDSTNGLLNSYGILEQLEPVTYTTSSDKTDAQLIKDDLHLQLTTSNFTVDNNPDMNDVSDNTRPNTTENFSGELINLNEPLQSESLTDEQIYQSSSSSFRIKPKVMSHLVGEFVFNKNGLIQTVQFPNSQELDDLADIPIMIIDSTTSDQQGNNTELTVDLNSTSVERTNLLAVLDTCNFTQNNLLGGTDSGSVNSTGMVIDNNNCQHIIDEQIMEVFHHEPDTTNIDNDCERHYDDHDDDSDSSSSYISELEDLEDEFEDVGTGECDTVIRENTSLTMNTENNLSFITDKDYNLSRNGQNGCEGDQFNETNSSSLAITDPSRLSSSTLNGSTNDSSYVPTPNLSSDQVDEFSNDASTLENLPDSDDDSIEELIKKSKPPRLQELIVPKAGKETKKSFCCYCFQSFVVISRHFEAIHSDEKEVQDFLALKKRSPARMAAIEKLRLKGVKLFNLNQDFNHGQLLVTRQPQQTSLADANDFKPCHKCGRWLQYINRHKCPYGKDDTEDRSGVIKSKLMMGQFHENATALTKKILAINNEDEISDIVRMDPLLIIFVNELSEKYTNPHQHSMIRSRVRMLGNIVSKMKEFNQKNFKNGKINQKCNPIDVQFFSDIINPRLYDNLIIAVQSIVGADAEKNECKAPSTATAAGTWITKIARLHEKELIKQLQYRKSREVEYFLKIHAVEFPTKINCLARNVQIKQKRHKEILLPSMTDINKFRDFIESHLVAAYTSLGKNGFNFRTWKLLAQLTLIYVLLFNRKRPGELERVRIDDYQRGKKFEETNPEEYGRLSAEEKKLVDEYVRFKFGGKKGREVPLIVSSGMQNFIKKILDHRSDAKVDPKNPFVFGMPGFDGTRYKHLQACVLMRKFSKLCNAEHPDRLRATQLRKQLATTVASLKIDECQIYDISNFMGHAEKIHRDYYRQSVVTRDLCGISKILEVASGVPSTVKCTSMNPDSRTLDSEESHSTLNHLEEDTLKTRGKVSYPSLSEESDDSNKTRLKEYKIKFQSKKRVFDSASSSDEDVEWRKPTLKKSFKKPRQKEIDNSEESCSTSNYLGKDSINIEKEVSSPSFTDESDNPNDIRLKEYKTKYLAKKQISDPESSSDEEVELRKSALKKSIKKHHQKEIDFPEVGLKRNNKKTRWSNEERNLVLKTFASYIKNMKVPPTANINECIANNPVIKQRTTAQIRTYIHNQFARKLKELKEI